jgi:acetolactate synthase regulatory subunit
VQAERAGNTLLSQLAKLEDVSDVELLAPNEAEGEAQVAKLGA